MDQLIQQGSYVSIREKKTQNLYTGKVLISNKKSCKVEYCKNNELIIENFVRYDRLTLLNINNNNDSSDTESIKQYQELKEKRISFSSVSSELDTSKEEESMKQYNKVESDFNKKNIDFTTSNNIKAELSTEKNSIINIISDNIDNSIDINQISNNSSNSNLLLPLNTANNFPSSSSSSNISSISTIVPPSNIYYPPSYTTTLNSTTSTTIGTDTSITSITSTSTISYLSNYYFNSSHILEYFSKFQLESIYNFLNQIDFDTFYLFFNENTLIFQSFFTSFTNYLGEIHENLSDLSVEETMVKMNFLLKFFFKILLLRIDSEKKIRKNNKKEVENIKKEKQNDILENSITTTITTTSSSPPLNNNNNNISDNIENSSFNIPEEILERFLKLYYDFISIHLSETSSNNSTTTKKKQKSNLANENEINYTKQELNYFSTEIINHINEFHQLFYYYLSFFQISTSITYLLIDINFKILKIYPSFNKLVNYIYNKNNHIINNLLIESIHILSYLYSSYEGTRGGINMILLTELNYYYNNKIKFKPFSSNILTNSSQNSNGIDEKFPTIFITILNCIQSVLSVSSNNLSSNKIKEQIKENFIEKLEEKKFPSSKNSKKSKKGKTDKVEDNSNNDNVNSSSNSEENLKQNSYQFKLIVNNFLFELIQRCLTKESSIEYFSTFNQFIQDLILLLPSPYYISSSFLLENSINLLVNYCNKLFSTFANEKQSERERIMDPETNNTEKDKQIEKQFEKDKQAEKDSIRNNLFFIVDILGNISENLIGRINKNLFSSPIENELQMFHSIKDLIHQKWKDPESISQKLYSENLMDSMQSFNEIKNDLKEVASTKEIKIEGIESTIKFINFYTESFERKVEKDEESKKKEKYNKNLLTTNNSNKSINSLTFTHLREDDIYAFYLLSSYIYSYYKLKKKQEEYEGIDIQELSLLNFELFTLKNVILLLILNWTQNYSQNLKELKETSNYIANMDLLNNLFDFFSQDHCINSSKLLTLPINFVEFEDHLPHINILTLYNYRKKMILSYLTSFQINAITNLLNLFIFMIKSNQITNKEKELAIKNKILKNLIKIFTIKNYFYYQDLKIKQNFHSKFKFLLNFFTFNSYFFLISTFFLPNKLINMQEEGIKILGEYLLYEQNNYYENKLIEFHEDGFNKDKVKNRKIDEDKVKNDEKILDILFSILTSTTSISIKKIIIKTFYTYFIVPITSTPSSSELFLPTLSTSTSSSLFVDQFFNMVLFHLLQLYSTNKEEDSIKKIIKKFILNTIFLNKNTQRFLKKSTPTSSLLYYLKNYFIIHKETIQSKFNKMVNNKYEVPTIRDSFDLSLFLLITLRKTDQFIDNYELFFNEDNWDLFLIISNCTRLISFMNYNEKSYELLLQIVQELFLNDEQKSQKSSKKEKESDNLKDEVGKLEDDEDDGEDFNGKIDENFYQKYLFILTQFMHDFLLKVDSILLNNGERSIISNISTSTLLFSPSSTIKVSIFSIFSFYFSLFPQYCNKTILVFFSSHFINDQSLSKQENSLKYFYILKIFESVLVQSYYSNQLENLPFALSKKDQNQPDEKNLTTEIPSIDINSLIMNLIRLSMNDTEKNCQESISLISLIISFYTDDIVPLYNLYKNCFFLIISSISQYKKIKMYKQEKMKLINSNNNEIESIMMKIKGEEILIQNKIQRCLVIIGFICEHSKKCYTTLRDSYFFFNEEFNTFNIASNTNSKTISDKEVFDLTLNYCKENFLTIKKINPLAIYGYCYSVCLYFLNNFMIDNVDEIDEMIKIRSIQSLCHCFSGYPRLLLYFHEVGELKKMLDIKIREDTEKSESKRKKNQKMIEILLIELNKIMSKEEEFNETNSKLHHILRKKRTFLSRNSTLVNNKRKFNEEGDSNEIDESLKKPILEVKEMKKNKLNDGTSIVSSSNIILTANDQDNDATIVGFILQQHLSSFLSFLYSSSVQIRFNALKLLETLLRQGMLCPLDVIDAIVRLQFDSSVLIQQESLKLLINIEERHENFFEISLLRGILYNINYQEMILRKNSFLIDFYEKKTDKTIIKRLINYSKDEHEDKIIDEEKIKENLTNSFNSFNLLYTLCIQPNIKRRNHFLLGILKRISVYYSKEEEEVDNSIKSSLANSLLLTLSNSLSYSSISNTSTSSLSHFILQIVEQQNTLLGEVLFLFTLLSTLPFEYMDEVFQIIGWIQKKIPLEISISQTNLQKELDDLKANISNNQSDKNFILKKHIQQVINILTQIKILKSFFILKKYYIQKFTNLKKEKIENLQIFQFFNNKNIEKLQKNEKNLNNYFYISSFFYDYNELINANSQLINGNSNNQDKNKKINIIDEDTGSNQSSKDQDIIENLSKLSENECNEVQNILFNETHQDNLLLEQDNNLKRTLSTPSNMKKKRIKVSQSETESDENMCDDDEDDEEEDIENKEYVNPVEEIEKNKTIKGRKRVTRKNIPEIHKIET